MDVIYDRGQTQHHGKKEKGTEKTHGERTTEQSRSRDAMDLPPLSHQALFASVRSADAAAVRALLADAEASGTTAAFAAAQTDAGETALYVAAEAGKEELVRLLLPLYDFDGATARSRLDLHAAAKQGHAGELSPSGCFHLGSSKL
jgi:hypothetical protein